jgi:hypothetical protein
LFNSLARFLDVALLISVGGKATIPIDLFLDFLAVAEDVENERNILRYCSECFVESFYAEGGVIKVSGGFDDCNLEEV